METLRKNRIWMVLLILVGSNLYAQDLELSKKNVEKQTAKIDSIKQIIQTESEKAAKVAKAGKPTENAAKNKVPQQQTLLTFKGRVVDAQGFGLPGASIMVQGTTVGTLTDFNGDFSLLTPLNSTVTVTAVGLNSLSLVAKDYNKLVINIDAMIKYYYCTNHSNAHVATTTQETERLKSEKGCIFF